MEIKPEFEGPSVSRSPDSGPWLRSWYQSEFWENVEQIFWKFEFKFHVGIYNDASIMDDNCETTQCINSTKMISYWNLIQHNKLIIIAYSIAKIWKNPSKFIIFLRNDEVFPKNDTKMSDFRWNFCGNRPKIRFIMENGRFWYEISLEFSQKWTFSIWFKSNITNGLVL